MVADSLELRGEGGLMGIGDGWVAGGAFNDGIFERFEAGFEGLDAFAQPGFCKT